MSIKAPFNFVPVSDKVFFPDWAEKISHDVPFSDGISGTLDLKITAESPIFVRNGHTQKDAEERNDNYKSFSNVNNKYFIPGTSLKGAIRNVLEIMSFSKMSVDDKRYSIRDLQLKDYTSTFQNAEVHCGWMKKEGEKVFISDNGIPYRVSHEEIDEFFNTNLVDTFDDSNKNFFKIDANKSSLYKYSLFENKSLNVKFNTIQQCSNTVDKRIKVSLSNDAQLSGEIVFTGQPGSRKKAKKGTNGKIINKANGKFYEFIFSDDAEKIIHECDFYETSGIFADFKFIYNKSVEWTYWLKKLNNGERVPVFFIKDSNDKIRHFGLSYLYKLPYTKTIKQFLSQNHNSDKYDFAECIFGSINSKSTLKGRVSFSNSFAEAISFLPENLVYMGSPSPTYYPIYLEQKGENGFLSEKERSFTTMLNNDAKIKGWKRYPIQDYYTDVFDIPKGQEGNSNHFIAAKQGSIFTSKVRFMNLRPMELGLLIKSLETSANLYHNIGFAKSYGYGAISIQINKLSCDDNRITSEFIHKFNDFANTNIHGYKGSKELLELNILRRKNDVDTDFSYMELDDFVNYKKHNKKTQGQYLQYLSNYIKLKPKTQNLRTEDIALVTLVSRSILKVKLNEGDNRTWDLIVPSNTNKPKMGDKIKVEIIKKGSNIDKIIYKGKAD